MSEEKIQFLAKRPRGWSLEEALAEWDRLHPKPSPPLMTLEECWEVVHRVDWDQPTRAQAKALRHFAEDLQDDHSP